MVDYSRELNDLVFQALDHGVSIITDAGHMIPFVMVQDKNGVKNLHTFSTETLEDGLQKAMEFVENQADNIIRYAVTWDGYVTISGENVDAILVEAGESVSREGYIIGQRYEKQGVFKKKNKPVGNAIMIEKISSRVYRR